MTAKRGRKRGSVAIWLPGQKSSISSGSTLDTEPARKAIPFWLNRFTREGEWEEDSEWLVSWNALNQKTTWPIFNPWKCTANADESFSRKRWRPWARHMARRLNKCTEVALQDFKVCMIIAFQAWCTIQTESTVCYILSVWLTFNTELNTCIVLSEKEIVTFPWWWICVESRLCNWP